MLGDNQNSNKGEGNKSKLQVLCGRVIREELGSSNQGLYISALLLTMALQIWYGCKEGFERGERCHTLKFAN